VEIPEAERKQLQLNQKLDAILGALGYQIKGCFACIDGVRECGLRSDLEQVRCYQCKGSGIEIEKPYKDGWDGD
jgi:hypothetical protein